MKVLAFSDMHLSRRCADDITQASADADLVIAAGDFCTMRNGLAEAMALLSGINAPLVMVPGNAESIDELRAAAPDTAHVLHGEGARIGGLTLFGLGYGIPVTPFGDWSCDMDDAAAEALLAGCSQADVLVTHSPPKGLGDVTSDGKSIGSVAIRAAIERIQPRLALFGHVHDSWGTDGPIGATRCVNLGPRVNWFDLP